MVDWTSIGLLLVGSYVIIKYGPQIAQSIQTASATGAAPPAAGAPGPAGPPGPAAPIIGAGGVPGLLPVAQPTVAQFQTLSNISPCPLNWVYDVGTNSCHPNPPLTGTGFTCPTGTISNGKTCVPLTSAPAPKTRAPAPSGCIPPCTHQTCPQTCPVPPNTRPAKTPVPTHVQAAASAPPITGPAPSIPGLKADPKNPQCGTNPCGSPLTPGQCLNPKTSKLVKCTPSAIAAVGYSIPVEGPIWYRTVRTYQANMTQVVTDPHTGQARKIVTIDPFFPSGWYLAEANARASLVEPGLH